MIYTRSVRNIVKEGKCNTDVKESIGSHCQRNILN
jgi:hypothetical protein